MKKTDEEVIIRDLQKVSGLYFPLMSETGLKSAVTPDLHGDAKTDQNHFLLEPASAEDLTEKNSMRNFFLQVRQEGEKEGFLFSLTGNSPADKVRMGTEEGLHATGRFTYGCMEVDRTYPYAPVTSRIISFVPFDRNEEIHEVTVTNTGTGSVAIRLTAAIPLYSRSADNIRDHRHVTSLLNRAVVGEDGIFLTPSMSFDERGHHRNSVTTYAVGFDEWGLAPEVFYPDLAAFRGAFDLTWPAALVSGSEGTEEKASYAPGERVDGKEVIGAFSFSEIILEEGQSVSYIVKIGCAESPAAARAQAAGLRSRDQVKEARERSHAYWASCSPLSVTTGDASFDLFAKWAAFQPTLRRIFGCSFLPHHDYGRGGRGWRDLWQDCLALLLFDPEKMRDDLIAQFGGVRTDGTNATIIGDWPGSFKSDRNNIPRLWCDHAAWPLQTILLYIEESGDRSILFEEAPYFQDAFTHRVSRKAEDAAYSDMTLSSGTVFEHLLLEQVTSAYDVGGHGNVRLHNADWNDAMDMAAAGGESLPFTAYYAGNLGELSALIEESGAASFELAEELSLLLKPMEEGRLPEKAEKQDLLNAFCDAAAGGFSGRKVEISAVKLAAYLSALSDRMVSDLNRSEFMEDGDLGYYRGYYDNDGAPLEDIGSKDISLIAQVYPLMFREVPGEKMGKLTASVKRLLFRPGRGGYALNSDFGDHFPAMKMGRMFGFAYGTKENGAVFSHMAVMYANALFKNDRREEGWEALRELFSAAMDFKTSRILPGIPEYFDLSGRGYYHYLTGAASWIVYTLVTEVYGLRGQGGSLRIAPRMVLDLFDTEGVGGISAAFRGLPLQVDCFLEQEQGGSEGSEIILKKLTCGEAEIPVADGCGEISFEQLQAAADRDGRGYISAIFGYETT